MRGGKNWSRYKLKGRPGKENRRFLAAVYWIVRSGAPWRDLPPEFGPWKTVYNRYNHWAKKGYLEGILEILKKDGNPEWHRLDGSTVRAHRHANSGSQEK